MDVGAAAGPHKGGVCPRGGRSALNESRGTAQPSFPTPHPHLKRAQGLLLWERRNGREGGGSALWPPPPEASLQKGTWRSDRATAAAIDKAVWQVQVHGGDITQKSERFFLEVAAEHSFRVFALSHRVDKMPRRVPDCETHCKASKGKMKITMKKYCKKDYGE
ncbi:Netrin-1 [Liparis tanakae]|uniref:Netrin-1 n=1 Tax=Liparis tanakae TaxID=230148 RepID=A0A4Z2GZN3_9TELE|nr:Netrin-1 [Liparis tanakae]